MQKMGPKLKTTETDIDVPENVKITRIKFIKRWDERYAVTIYVLWNNVTRDFWGAGETPVEAITRAIANSRTCYYD